MLTSIIVGIFGLSLLVIVHEAGHYFAARAFGMRVTRFSIGFGPVLVSHTPKGSPTTFQICAIPFLAYVMIAGMNPAEEVDPKDPGLFSNKSVFGRIVTIFAGPFANYLAASVMIFFVALFAWQEAVPTEPMVVAEVAPGSPAAIAGLKVEDVVIEGNGVAIRNVKQLIAVTKDRAGKPTTYVVERDGKRLAPLTITPKQGAEHAIIGVIAKTTVISKSMPIDQAALTAIVKPFELSIENLVGIASLIERRTTEGITGPVGMGKLVAEQAQRGVLPFVHVLILISVALGLFNLLPVPALDGGRLVFLGYELITRKRPNERFEMVVHAAGMLFLIGVLALVTLRDVLG